MRERHDLTLAQAVYELTGRQAEVFGFRGRGVIAPGNVADLVVFALDELHYDDDEFVHDLPGGGRDCAVPKEDTGPRSSTVWPSRSVASSPAPCPVGVIGSDE